MPFVRIDLREGTSAAYRRAIADAVYQALVETMGVPVDDRFQVISEHTGEGLIYDRTYLGIERTDAVIFVQITLSAGRKPAQKRALYARITEMTCGKRLRHCTAAQAPIRPVVVIAS